MLTAVALTFTPGFLAAPVPAEKASAAVYAELGLVVPADAPAELPAAYLPDAVGAEDVKRSPDKYPSRAATLKAVAALSEARALVPATLFVRDADLNSAAALKAVFYKQERPALAIVALEDAQVALKAAAMARAAEPSQRWQAHFDYVSAAVDFRIAYVHEYNLLLGSIRTRDLPALDATKRQTGWRLTAADTMRSRRDVKDQAEAARKAFAAVIEAYPKTPWAGLASAGRDAKPGLAWEPAADPNEN